MLAAIAAVVLDFLHGSGGFRGVEQQQGACLEWKRSSHPGMAR